MPPYILPTSSIGWKYGNQGKTIFIHEKKKVWYDAFEFLTVHIKFHVLFFFEIQLQGLLDEDTYHEKKTAQKSWPQNDLINDSRFVDCGGWKYKIR